MPPSIYQHPLTQKASFAADEVISEFFNAVLDSELPVDALATLTDFLEIVDASTASLDIARKSAEDSLLPAKSELPKKLAEEMFALSAVCRAEILRAEGHSIVAERIATSFTEEALSQREPATVSVAEPLTPPAFSQRLQESMHAALMKVMTERDMSHARLAAAEVLHVHELEQQRKLNTRLSAELQASRVEGKQTPLDNEKDRRTRQMQQSSDDELMSLCQQLAGEISARTTASLEVVRLKESRQMEEEHHLNEIQSLKGEIQKLRGELGTEKNKTEAAETELSGWQRSYRDIIQYEAAST